MPALELSYPLVLRKLFYTRWPRGSLAASWHGIGRSNFAMPSTAIKSYEYISAEKRLRITYISGAIYDYLGVPAEVYAAMKAYRSKGTFVNQEIKGRYPFQKIF